MKKLTQTDFCKTASEIGCEVETIQAVSKVESGGRGGFDDGGRLLLRFEGHHFRKYTGGKYDLSHPQVSYPYSQQRWKPHGYSAFNQAFALDRTAAMMACSFGMFQVLGSHFDDLGFDSVAEFVDFLKQGEPEQLEIFVRFCRVNHLLDEIRRNDFAGFARVYNGARYKDFNYDVQMKNYYKNLKSKKIDCKKLLSSAQPEKELSEKIQEPTDKTIQDLDKYIEPDSTANRETAVSKPPATNPQVPVEANAEVASASAFESFEACIPQIETGKSYLKRAAGFLSLSSIGAFFGGLPQWLVVSLIALLALVIAGGIVLFAIYYKEVFAYVRKMNELRADPNVNSPQIKS